MKWPHAVCVHWAKRPFHWASLRLSVFPSCSSILWFLCSHSGFSCQCVN